MMPIRGTPILIHLMRFYETQGFSDFVLAAGWRKEILDDYFDRRFPQWNVTVVDTGPASDTGERIRRCEPYLGPTFFATYGDGLGNVDLHELLEFHRESAGLATVTSVPLRSQYGTVRFTEGRQVQAFEEKPTIRDYWINAGFFVFEKAAFDHWHGANLENEVLPKLAKRGALYTYLHGGFWKSMDTSKDQQEFETILGSGSAPWMDLKPRAMVQAAS
jgi:glucose-1-phosphate cytidylyltransferase